MDAAPSFFTQSKYHNQAFNSAIFDGPMRIYFAQFQEALALKLYFQVQERLKALAEEMGEGYKHISPKLFLLLYPNRETYLESFEKDSTDQSHFTEEPFGDDIVIGVSGILSEAKYALILETIIKRAEINLKSITSAKSI